jgi:hypothetical protein
MDTADQLLNMLEDSDKLYMMSGGYGSNGEIKWYWSVREKAFYKQSGSSGSMHKVDADDVPNKVERERAECAKHDKRFNR